MSARQKLSDYRKKLRHQEQDKLFARRRLEMLYPCWIVGEEDTNMNKLSQLVSKQPGEQLCMEELELLARMSTEEHGIVVIKHAEMLPRLLVFLEGRFCGDRKQELASLIICNMFYVKEEELPGETLFQMVLPLIVAGNETVRNNCLNTLNHILQDFPAYKTQIVQRYHLVDKLVGLFNNQPETLTILELLKVVYFLLKESQKRDEYRKFNRFLNTIIIASNEHNLVLLAIYCWKMIYHMHSKEMAEDVKQSKIISRIIRFSELAPAMKLTYYTLEIIHISIQHLTVEDFREILNMLTKVNLKGYELGNYSAVYTVSKIKTLAYRTIYEFLSRIPKCLQYFRHHSLFNILTIELEETEDPSIAEELAYLFSIVILNQEQSNYMMDKLRKGILRAELLNKGNADFSQYLRSIDNYQTDM